MTKHSKIKNAFISIFVSMLAIVLGLFAGSGINTKYFSLNKYNGLNIEDLMDDFSKIKYEGKTPDQLTAVEAYLVSIYLLENKDYYKKEIFGDMQTNVGINQKLHTINLKNGEDYDFSYVSSSSMYTTTVKAIFKKNGEVREYLGNAKGTTIDTVEWTEKYKSFTYDEYTEVLGRTAEHENSYIISSKTVVSQSKCEINNGLYTYKLVLDPIKSTLTYINEISYRSGVDKSTIDIHSVEMEFTVDKDFNLVSEHHLENYSFKFGGIPVTLLADYSFTITY